MRVLIVHNRYRSGLPSGENRIVDLEVEALRAQGVDVAAHFRESDMLQGSVAGLTEAVAAQVRPAASLKSLRALLRRVRPDVVHLHNPFPLIPPALVKLAHNEEIPVVQTLHNARHGCPRSDFIRDGGPCFDCLGRRFPAPAVIHSCYRDSASQSLVLAASLAVNRGNFAAIDRFVAVSQSLKEALGGSHLPQDRIVVVPHGIPDPGRSGPLGRDVLFLGRLEPEKGVSELLSCWRDSGAAAGRLLIAGSGRLEKQVRIEAASMDNVRYVGQLAPGEVQAAIAGALAVVVPSIVPESFGLTAVEAFASGRPVIASKAGALRDLVDESVGWSFGTWQELTSILASLDPAEAARRGAAARQRYLERYTLEASTQQLIGVLESARRRD